MARRQGYQPTRPDLDDDAPPGGPAAPGERGDTGERGGGDDGGEADITGAASGAGADADSLAGAGVTAVTRAVTTAATTAVTTATSAPGVDGAAGVTRGRTRGISGRALRGLPGGRQDDDSPLALDRLIHERLRLGIVSALAVNDALTFVELKGRLQTTDGNLSVHARKLEEAGYLSCTKAFDGRTPRTEYRLTRAGRHALERYLDHMEALIKATRAPRPD